MLHGYLSEELSANSKCPAKISLTILARLYSDNANAKVSTCLVVYLYIRRVEYTFMLYLTYQRNVLSDYIIDMHSHSYTELPHVVV